MTEEFEELIRARLRAETGAVQPRVGLLTDVRRMSRRHTMRDGVVAIAAVGALTIGGMFAWPHIGSTTHDQTGAPTPSATSTYGDLRHDTAYLNQVKQLILSWERHYKAADGPKVMSTVFRGQPDPQIVWAANTPAGKAAVAIAWPRFNDGAGSWRRITTYAFVAAGTDGKPRLVRPFADKSNVPDQAAGVFIGADRRTLVVASTPATRYISLRANRDKAGQAHRTYSKVHFTGPVRVISVPADVDPNDVVMLPTPNDSKHRAQLTNVPAENAQPQRLLGWMASPWQIGNPDSFWRKGDDPLERQLTNLSKAETALDATDSGSQGAQWYAYGTTSHGDHVIVTDIQGDRTEAHVVATLYPPNGQWRTVVDGPADKASTLPVRVQLPAGNGWVVAAKGATLSYRIGSGSWEQPRQNAALCPANATAVRVVNHGTTSVVPLS